MNMSTKYFKSLDESVPEGELVRLKDVKKGDWIKRSLDTRKVYRKSHYVRDEGFNRYSCDDVEDINREIFLKGGAIVWVGFTY
jgi:hypothetical protein